VYTSPAGPRRYRLVDPDASTARTLAYVEIPDDATFDPEVFIGRRIGVLARSRVLQTGGVEPIIIFVADELVPLTELETPKEVVSDARPGT